jgi:hypothetical protein
MNSLWNAIETQLATKLEAQLNTRLAIFGETLCQCLLAKASPVLMLGR